MSLDLRLLIVNDVYASEPVNGLGGLPNLSTMIAKYRTPASLFIVAGDFLGGSALAEQFHGKHMVEVLNYMGVDLVVIGNHEFDYGDAGLKDRIGDSRFAWFGGNIYEESTGKVMEGVLSTQMRTFPLAEGEGSVNVGFFGVCTRATPALSYPTKNVIFKSEVDVSADLANALRTEGADVVVGLTHVKLEMDKAIAKASRAAVLVGGHDHEPAALVEKETLVFKTGQNAYWLGIVDLRIEVTSALAPGGGSMVRTVSVFPSWQMIQNRGFAPDPGCVAIIEEYKKRAAEINAATQGDPTEVLRVLDAELDSRTSTVRVHESNFGTTIADAMVHVFAERKGHKPDCGILNGGFIRADKLYPVGHQLTVGDIRHELPFPRTCKMLKIRGEHLRATLEQQLAPHPTPSGSYPHPSSELCVVFDRHAPPLSRVQSITIRGEPLDNDKNYYLVVTSFMAEGGDGVVALREGVSEGETSQPVADVVIPYLRGGGPIAGSTGHTTTTS